MHKTKIIIIIVMATLSEKLQQTTPNPITQNYLSSYLMADMPRNYQMQVQNKNENDIEPNEIVFPANNIDFCSSLLQKQETKCARCIDLDKKMQSAMSKIQSEKKKSLKYVSIIQCKIEKEKQLKQAYYQIARQLKKKIDAAQNYQLQQICSWKQQNQPNLVYNNKNQGILPKPQHRHLQYVSNIINQAFDLQQSKPRHECSIVPFQIIKFKGLQGENQSLRGRGSTNIRIQQIQNQRQSETELVKNFIHKQQQQQQLKQDQSNQVSYRTVNQWEQEHFSSILQSKLIYQIQNARQSLFKSIKEDSQIGLSNLSINNSFTIEPEDKDSQRQIPSHYRQERQYNLNNMIEEQGEHRQGKQVNFIQLRNKEKLMRRYDEQREDIKHFILNIKHFLAKLTHCLNTHGQRYKVQSKVNNLLTNYAVVSPSSDLSELLISKDKLHEIGESFEQNIQKILKQQQKQYQKMQNNKDLIIYDLKSKFAQYQREKQQNLKIIENYQMHKEILQMKYLQLQEKSLGKGSQFKEPSTNRSEYMSQLRRRVSMMTSEKCKSKQTQCSILSSDLIYHNLQLQLKNNELTSALAEIPTILNDIFPKISANETFTINFQENIHHQLSRILRSRYQQLKTEEMNTHEAYSAHSTRIRSASMTPKLNRKHSENYYSNSLQAQNKQLKMALQLKSQELLKCSEKATSYKMEKSNLEQKVSSLVAQIERLTKINKQLSSQRYNTPIKNEMNQSKMKNSRCSVVASEKGQFMEYLQKKQYNNLYWDRDEQLKELKVKVETYEQQLKAFRLQSKKKKKIIYIDK